MGCGGAMRTLQLGQCEGCAEMGAVTMMILMLVLAMVMAMIVASFSIDARFFKTPLFLSLSSFLKYY